MRQKIISKINSLLVEVEAKQRIGKHLRDLPLPSQLSQQALTFYGNGEQPDDSFFLDVYHAMRIYGVFPNQMQHAINLVGNVINLDFPYRKRSGFQASLWRGIMTVAMLTVDHAIHDAVHRRAYFGNLLMTMDFPLDVEFSDLLSFFRTRKQFSESLNDTNWLVANIELRRAIVGQVGYQEERDYALRLIEVAQAYNFHVHCIASNLLTHICWHYQQYEDAADAAIESLNLSHANERPHLERISLTTLLTFAVNERDHQLFDIIYKYWKTIETPTNQKYRQAMIDGLKCLIHYHKGNYHTAERIELKVYKTLRDIAVYEDHINIQNQLAMIYVKLEDTPMAVHFSNEAFLIAHYRHYGDLRTHALYIKGWALVKGGLYKTGISVLVQAIHSNLQQKNSPHYQRREDGLIEELVNALENVSAKEIDLQDFNFIDRLQDAALYLKLLESGKNRKKLEKPIRRLRNELKAMRIAATNKARKRD